MKLDRRRHPRTSEPGATTTRTTTPIRRRFGQHFLAPAWAEKVVDVIAPAPGDVFLEIGPGRGALTLPLAATGVPILAVEIDRDLVKDLAQRAPAHVTLVTGDFLRTDVIPFLTGLQPQRPPTVQPAAIARRFRVVGNVPYNVSSPILFRLIDLYRQHKLFTDATIMVQREVADRLVAEPGVKTYGVLTVSAQMHTRITRLLDLPPGAFRPPPKVRSSVVRLAFGPPAVRVPDERLFDWLVRGLFSARRKTLANAMKRLDAKGHEALALTGLDGRRRPETLQVTELARLAEMLAAVRRPGVL